MQHLSLLPRIACCGSDPACGRNSPTNFEHRWCRSGCEPRCQTSLVNDSALIRARAGDHQAFAALTDPYRRELQLHCYRILGQVQDAEDAVQETLLSAWGALDVFEERSSLRSWLYRIATNRCLNMLRDSGRRPATTSGVASPPPEPTRYGEVLWLEPYPDALLEGIVDGAADPEARYETREAVTLAFVTALHRLPPRQRAVLVLRDVLGFSAIDVAAMLDTSATSVNSALIRARATIEERGPRAHDRAPLPRSAQERELVARFADAFERGEVEPIAAVFVCVAALIAAAPPASAIPLPPSNSPLPGSSFQGADGNQGDAAPYTDWQGLQAAGRVHHNPDPNAQDSAFVGGNKEDNPG